MNYLNFSSRETYLATRKQWSADYLTAVKTIRQAKLGIKEAMRAGEFTWKAYAALRDAHEAIQKLASARCDMRAEAQKQYQASRLAS